MTASLKVLTTKDPLPPAVKELLDAGPQRMVLMNVVGDETFEFYMGADVTLEDLLWWKQTLTHEINTIYAEEA